MRIMRKVFFAALVATYVLSNVDTAFADVSLPPFPLFVPFWPLAILGAPYLVILPLLVSVLIYRHFKKKQLSQARSAFLAYLATTVLIIALYALLRLTGDLPGEDLEAKYFRRGVKNAAYSVGNLRSLREGVVASLTDGRELPVGMFGAVSSVVLNDIAPYMAYPPDRAIVVLSADSPLKMIRSPDAMPSALYAGFYKLDLMEVLEPEAQPGFFTRLLGFEKKGKVKPRYKNQVVQRLAVRAESEGLYKNGQGEPYEGGDTILMKVF